MQYALVDVVAILSFCRRIVMSAKCHVSELVLSSNWFCQRTGCPRICLPAKRTEKQRIDCKVRDYPFTQLPKACSSVRRTVTLKNFRVI